ncbi:MAG: thiamine phosphate synthase [Neisseriaceae bacterium]|nr:MAG: thiamine phosphate synthase [Neisseriaceae bacterium]
MDINQLALYFIMGSQDTQNPLKILESALQKGITLFQFREKGRKAKTGNDCFMFAKTCQNLCHQYHVPFLVNDNIDLALSLNADGVHVGADDMPLKELKKILPEHMILGYSVHNEQDLALALQEKVDYIGVGPIFPTNSKSDAKEPIGIKELTSIKKTAPNIPIVAIGGINANNYQPVLQTGIEGIAFISAICQNPEFITEYLAYYHKLKGINSHYRK